MRSRVHRLITASLFCVWPLATPASTLEVRSTLGLHEIAHELLAAKVFEGGALNLIYGLLVLDPDGLMSYAVKGDQDPYVSLVAQQTNLTDGARFATFTMVSPTVDVTGPSTVELALRLKLEDRNGDDEALFAGGGANFWLGEHASGAMTVFPPIPIALGSAGTFDLLASRPLVVPAPPPLALGASAWNQLGFQVNANLSAGDAITIEAFICVRGAAAACPAIPDLQLPAVPEPGTYAQLAAGLLALLVIVGARRRR